MRFLKINGKSIMQVKSQYWLYEDIKRYFLNNKLEFFVLKIEEENYCFIKADFPREKLELLIMGGSTNMFAYSDYIVVKVKNNNETNESDERLRMDAVFKAALDFEQYEINAFQRWHSLVEEANGTKILDLGELQRGLKLEKNKKDKRESDVKNN